MKKCKMRVERTEELKDKTIKSNVELDMGKEGRKELSFNLIQTQQLQQTQSSCMSPRHSACHSVMALDNLLIPQTMVIRL